MSSRFSLPPPPCRSYQRHTCACQTLGHNPDGAIELMWDLSCRRPSPLYAIDRAYFLPSSVPSPHVHICRQHFSHKKGIKFRVPDAFVNLKAFFDVCFACSAETVRYRDAVLHCLTSSLHLIISVFRNGEIHWWEGKGVRRLQGEQFDRLSKSTRATDLE